MSETSSTEAKKVDFRVLQAGFEIGDIVSQLYRSPITHFKTPDCETQLDQLNSIYFEMKKLGREANTTICRKLNDLGVAELCQHVWRAQFNEAALEEEMLMANLRSLVGVIWNVSDVSAELCERVVSIGLHLDLFEYLTLPWMDASRRDNSNKMMIVFSLLSVLHNVAKGVADIRAYRKGRPDAPQLLIPFSKYNCPQEDSSSEDPQAVGLALFVAAVALMTQVYLITEEENHLILSDGRSISFLILLLSRAVRSSERSFAGFAIMELVVAINKVAVNDTNKDELIKAGVLKCYVRLLGKDWPTEEQAAAAQGIWTLAFKCKDAILKETDCVKALEDLLGSSEDKNVLLQTEGALITLGVRIQKSFGTDAAVAVSLEKGEGHVFISYQRDSRAIVLRIYDHLKANGHRVWLDVYNMSGSAYDSMAYAVEHATAVVLCMTPKYYESPYCKQEATYAARKHKQLIPVMLQSGYKAEGWLGIITSVELAIDFSGQDTFEPSIKSLLRELHKETDSNVNEDVIEATHASLTNAASEDCVDGPVKRPKRTSISAADQANSSKPNNGKCSHGVYHAQHGNCYCAISCTVL